MNHFIKTLRGYYSKTRKKQEPALRWFVDPDTGEHFTSSAYGHYAINHYPSGTHIRHELTYEPHGGFTSEEARDQDHLNHRPRSYTNGQKLSTDEYIPAPLVLARKQSQSPRSRTIILQHFRNLAEGHHGAMEKVAKIQSRHVPKDSSGLIGNTEE